MDSTTAVARWGSSVGCIAVRVAFVGMFAVRALPFDLVFSTAAREQIVAMTSSANRALSSPDQWPAPIDSRASITKWRSMLSASEIDAVRSIVQPVSDKFYGDGDWG